MKNSKDFSLNIQGLFVKTPRTFRKGFKDVLKSLPIFDILEKRVEIFCPTLYFFVTLHSLKQQ